MGKTQRPGGRRGRSRHAPAASARRRLAAGEDPLSVPPSPPAPGVTFSPGRPLGICRFRCGRMELVLPISTRWRPAQRGRGVRKSPSFGTKSGERELRGHARLLGAAPRAKKPKKPLFSSLKTKPQSQLCAFNTTRSAPSLQRTPAGVLPRGRVRR